MNHVILASAGSHGDVFPFVALGKVLRSRGNRVTLAANEPYRRLAIEHGFEFASLVSAEETHELLSDPDVWHPVKCGLVGARWGARLLQSQYERLSELACEKDSIMAASPAMIAARLVQEKSSRPLASIYYMPWMIPSCSAPPAMTGGWSLPRWTPWPLGELYWRSVDLVGHVVLGRHLNRLRKSIGLAPVRRIFRWWISPDLAIGLFPRWYARPQPDWPSQLRLAGFAMMDGRTDNPLAPDVLDFCRAGAPTLVITFGAGMMHAADLFREAVEACRQIGARGILLTRHRTQVSGVLPDSIRHFEYVPLGQLLPHCAAIVHHGGIGTVANALAAGTPQLVIPHAWDQLDNGLRVIKLGVGGVVRRRRGNSSRIARALIRVLDRTTKARCLEIAHQFEGEEVVTAAAQWVEELAGTSTSS